MSYALSLTTYQQLAHAKTGALFKWCLIAQALLCSIDEVHINKLSQLGLQLGLIFQTGRLVDLQRHFKENSLS